MPKTTKDSCPICKEPPEIVCRCFRHDCQCKNGHSWHTCVIHQKIVPGSSDHSIDTFTCTCEK